jgi:hypothetical protein
MNPFEDQPISVRLLGVIGGVLFAGIGILGFRFGWWLMSVDGPLEFLQVAASGGIAVASVAFVWIGVKLTWSAIRSLFARGTDSVWSRAGRPWLRNPQWRKRAIVQTQGLGTPVFLLASSVFGPAALIFFAMALDPSQGFSDRIGTLLMGGFFAFIVCGVGYWWLRSRRYGRSVCRLLTLPGVVGGWFKADVECILPPDPEPVVVRLKNLVPIGQSVTEVWGIEETLYDVPVASGARSVVRVRLRVPRDSAQRCQPLKAGLWDDFAVKAAWVLEIEKRAAGIDFFASFPVPIYDTPDAPATEQREE